MFDSLLGGMSIEGPAIIMNGTSTCVIEPACVGEVTAYGDLKITVPITKAKSDDANEEDYSKPDAILISIFSNRFMGIAERMGRTLQRTSVSTNIKERLDSFCDKVVGKVVEVDSARARLSATDRKSTRLNSSH